MEVNVIEMTGIYLRLTCMVLKFGCQPVSLILPFKDVIYFFYKFSYSIIKLFFCAVTGETMHIHVIALSAANSPLPDCLFFQRSMILKVDQNCIRIQWLVAIFSLL